MQPLDVSVFAPMKRAWRKHLKEWKDEGAANGEVYATIPKKVGTIPTYLGGTYLGRYLPYLPR